MRLVSRDINHRENLGHEIPELGMADWRVEYRRRIFTTMRSIKGLGLVVEDEIRVSSLKCAIGHGGRSGEAWGDKG